MGTQAPTVDTQGHPIAREYDESATNPNARCDRPKGPQPLLIIYAGIRADAKYKSTKDDGGVCVFLGVGERGLGVADQGIDVHLGGSGTRDFQNV